MADTQSEPEHRPMMTRTQVITFAGNLDNTAGTLFYRSRCTCGYLSAWERLRKNAEGDLTKHLKQNGVGVDS